MKKILTLIIVFATMISVKAQWVNDPTTNTFLANTSADAGEIYLSTCPNGDIYAQWSSFVGGNGWAPTLQRINADGVPQWDNGGIHPSYHQMASWSQGFAMTATSDGAVVTCFATEAGQTIAIKINADGTYAWGEEGLTLFGGAGESRTELLAGDDGGVWALGTSVDNGNLYLCYIEANGTLNPTITISDDTGKLCMFGLLTPAPNGNVFVVYEKEQWAYTYFYEKDIRVVGYSKDGTQISDDVQLMSPVTIPGSYTHYVVPDGLGGAYVYIWHAGGQGGNFNTYVFHFNQNGASTISNLNGIPVHSEDPYNYYIDAYATVDPVSHDLIIVYVQTDQQFQQESRVYANRFNVIGDRLWNEGILFVEENGNDHSNLLIDAFEYGGGYTFFYNEGDGYNSTIKALGIDDNGNQIWSTNMSTNSYPRTMCENSTGHHDGQNIVAWVNGTNGGLYGQNIGQSGEMGEITPPTPPAPCDAPTNFQGEYVYTNNMFGAMISWDAPETTPLHYNIYFEGTKDVIEVDPEYTSYFIEMEASDYIFKLTAVYDDCESNYALTPDGEMYVIVEVTSVPENEYEEIVNVIEIYNISGQRVNSTEVNELNQGIYIIKGVTTSGKTIVRKVIR
ncbi:MAG: T9SS type A sorting domain-containing protein [Bacteroidales bacterium]|nr:T9SS type A sorting domain-containing protein [Bacteroidales bacterium]